MILLKLSRWEIQTIFMLPEASYEAWKYRIFRWEIQTIFMLPEASYEAWKYRIFRPKERRQQHCRGIQQKNGGLNRVMITVIALVASGLQAEYRGPDGSE